MDISRSAAKGSFGEKHRTGSVIRVLLKIIALIISLAIGYVWFMGCNSAALRDSVFLYMTTYADLGMFLIMEFMCVTIGQLIIESVETERK